ncbi:hypothetical protein ZOSMA_767G00040 [Zostera marina]|uniref:Pentatricopeptide repeat-containing protein n=1 Tax=Zostera marina TaxID=29655 RepID=A0A0K9NPM5_ZOSMR|nr:hypothetical protein ZOSMA_767G00040 [Zostera marina]
MIHHRLGLESQMSSVQQLLLEMKLQGLKCSDEIFVTVIRSYSKTRCSSQALDTFHRMLEFGCKPTFKIYNHLLDAMLRDSRFQMIAPIYRDMKRDGIDPNIYTYNILIKALCKIDKIDVAYKLLDEMSSKGCIPDEVSYTTIVSSLSQSGKLTEASDLVTRLPAVIPAYNALINGMCSHRHKDAVSLMKEIDGRGLQPNVITYTTIINSLCNAGDLRLSLVLFSKMLVKGCTPNTVTLTSLIKGLFAQGKLSEAMEIWDFMVEEPSIITYNVVIHCLCSNGCLPMARSIFSEMEQGNNNHVLPNAGT